MSPQTLPPTRLCPGGYYIHFINESIFRGPFDKSMFEILGNFEPFSCFVGCGAHAFQNYAHSWKFPKEIVLYFFIFLDRCPPCLKRNEKNDFT